MFSRKPHYELPAEIRGTTLTLLLQQPLKLHDMEVIHITFEREALANWLKRAARSAVSSTGSALPNYSIWMSTPASIWSSAM